MRSLRSDCFSSLNKIIYLSSCHVKSKPVSMCFYCKNFNGVCDNLDLKRKTRFEMSVMRRVEPLKSWRVKHRLYSPTFLSVVKCVFVFRTSCHKYTSGKQMGGVMALCFNVYAVNSTWGECLPRSANAQCGSHDAYALHRFTKQKDDSPDVTGYESCRRVNMIFPSHVQTELARRIKQLAASYHYYRKKSVLR